MSSLWSSILQSRYHGLPDRPIKNRVGQTPINNVFVAGNVAGTPNIKASMMDGYHVGLNIAKRFKQSPYRLRASVGIIGGGPAGIGTALALRKHNISFVIWEQGELFNSIAAYTEGKQIYSLPREWTLPNNLWFEDSPKGYLLNKWNEQLLNLKAHVHSHHKVTDIRRYNDIFNIYVEHQENISISKVSFVVLATGTQSQPKKLNIVGEDLPQVKHNLYTPKEYLNNRVVVVGGGSSALEAVLNLVQQGTHCKLIHRGSTFDKAADPLIDELNQWKDSGMLEIYTQCVVTEFTPFSKSHTQVTVKVKNISTNITQHIVVNQALVLIGGTPHNTLLNNIGLKTEQKGIGRLFWWLPFIALVYGFYLLKSGAHEVCTSVDCPTSVLEAKRHFFPLTVSWLNNIPTLLQYDMGFRIVDGAFWGTMLYSMLIVVFGIKAMRKYPSQTQQRRYISLIVFQAVFLFGIPEIIAPWIISMGNGLDFFGGNRPWKLYSMFIPWPLSIYSLVDSPSYMNVTNTNSVSIAIMWILFGAMVSFVAIPLYVRKHGQRFCSSLCGCGGLAETLGDAFRSYTPKGLSAKNIEKLGRGIWVLAILVTGLILNDAWQFISTPAIFQAKLFAEKWYTLMVDFWLASVIGVALYPYFGNRIWCRFACPLRAYMETIAKYTTKLSIESKDTCIGCYECTRQCQMGIPVHEFALRQHSLTNQNAACIQCGICIEVCPLDVLTIGNAGEPVKISFKTVLSPPIEPWARV